MIVCYYGQLGQGKTYNMTRDAIAELDKGGIVYSNYFLNWNGVNDNGNLIWWILGKLRIRNPRIYPVTNLRPINTFMDVTNIVREKDVNAYGATLVLDEGWIEFDSYDAQRLGKDVRKKIAFSRKDGINIFYTTQRPMQVHKFLRALTNVYFECKVYNFLMFSVFKQILIDFPSESHTDKIEVASRTFWPSNRVFSSFDTLEKIGDVDISTRYAQATKEFSQYNEEVREEPFLIYRLKRLWAIGKLDIQPHISTIYENISKKGSKIRGFYRRVRLSKADRIRLREHKDTETTSRFPVELGGGIDWRGAQVYTRRSFFATEETYRQHLPREVILKTHNHV